MCIYVYVFVYSRINYLIAPRIPPGRIEGSVPGRFSGSVEFPEDVLERQIQDVLEREIQDVLEREIQDVLEREIQDGLERCLGGPRGVLGRHRKQRRFFRGVWRGSGAPLGVILVVWSGPWDRTGRCKC